MAAFAAALLGSDASLGKNPNYQPDLSEEKFWNTYNASVVRVTRVDKGQDGRERVTLEPLLAIIGDVGTPLGTVRENDLWFGLNPFEWPKVEAGVRLLIMYEADKWPAVVVAEIVEGDITKNRRVSGLLQIAAIRAVGQPLAALQEGALDSEKTIALYCLKRLFAKHARELPPELVPRLRKHAGDETLDPTVRLFAVRLAEDVAANGDTTIAAEEERRWLCDSIRDSKSCDFAQLLTLVRWLAEFPQFRRENVEFLTATVADAKLRKDVRSAAAGPLSSEALFHFKSPDAESDRIHRTFVSLLEDGDKGVRTLAASHLSQIACQSNPQGAAARYVKASRDAISSRLAAETDEITKFHMKTDLEMIDLVRGQAR